MKEKFQCIFQKKNSSTVLIHLTFPSETLQKWNRKRAEKMDRICVDEEGGSLRRRKKMNTSKRSRELTRTKKIPITEEKKKKFSWEFPCLLILMCVKGLPKMLDAEKKETIGDWRVFRVNETSVFSFSWEKRKSIKKAMRQIYKPWHVLRGKRQKGWMYTFNTIT